MDSRLSEASKTGDIQLLHQSMAENPLLLHNLALTSIENPLHVASLAGHVEFVQEIVKLRPAFVHEMNHDGFSPMHIAAANGYLEVVRELLRVDPRLCRMKGRDQWTPLHYAAARGRGDVVGEMVLACPESLEDVTLHEETSLHLAVNNCQFEAVKILVELVMELRKDNVLNMKDKYGNSVLHVATWKKQHQVVEWLVGNGTTPSALEVNTVNQSSLTPLDLLLIFPSEAGDREIEEILRGAGASRAQDIGASRAQDIQHTPSHGPMETNTLQLQQPNNPMEYFNSMGSDDNNFFARFVGTNSMGFFVSLYMIGVLTSNFPMQLVLLMCIHAMYGTYNIAVISIAPANPMVFVSLLICGLPFLLSLVVLFWRLIRIRLRELH
nr:ankyrin repeat-containing protein BDA1 isoform X2 [Malus domestica]